MKPDPAGATSSQISLREYLEAKIDAECRQNKIFREAQAKEFDLFKESQAKEIREAAANVSDRLKLLNELRAEVIQDRANFITREKYDAEMGARNVRVELLEKWQASRAGFHDQVAALQATVSGLERWKNENASIAAVVDAVDKRLDAMETWRSKLLGVWLGIGFLAGLAGAALMRVLTGFFGK
jgi:hypothetical protein